MAAISRQLICTNLSPQPRESHTNRSPPKIANGNDLFHFSKSLEPTFSSDRFSVKRTGSHPELIWIILDYFLRHASLTRNRKNPKILWWVMMKRLFLLAGMRDGRDKSIKRYLIIYEPKSRFFAEICILRFVLIFPIAALIQLTPVRLIARRRIYLFLNTQMNTQNQNQFELWRPRFMWKTNNNHSLSHQFYTHQPYTAANAGKSRIVWMTSDRSHVSSDSGNGAVKNRR